MKRWTLLTNAFLATIMSVFAGEPQVCRYSFPDGVGTLSVDTTAVKINIELATVSTNSSRFNSSRPMGWTLRWNDNSSGYDFVRISESRYTAGEAYSAVIGRYESSTDSDTVIDSTTVNVGLPSYPNATWTTLNWSDGRLTVYCGSTKIRQLFSLDCPIPVSSRCSVTGRNIAVESVVIETWHDIASTLATDYDEISICSHATLTGNPLEGIWTYFDRNTDEACARLGGRYRLGVVYDDAAGCYLVVYLGGAVVNPTQWRCGMIKGMLKPTPFENQYHLVWYDSALEQVEIDVDAYATLENSSLLTLAFPLYSTSFRLAREK